MNSACACVFTDAVLCVPVVCLALACVHVVATLNASNSQQTRRTATASAGQS